MKIRLATIENSNPLRATSLEAAIELLVVQLGSSKLAVTDVDRVVRLENDPDPASGVAPALASLLQVARTFLELSEHQQRCEGSFQLTKPQALRRAFKEVFLRQSRPLRSWDLSRRAVWVENQVSRKHLLAWRRFADSDADFLVVLEDDVTTHSRSAALVPTLAKVLGSAEYSDLLFVDIAGGYDLFALPNAGYEEILPGVFRSLLCQTNTAAGYVVSRNLASALVDRIGGDSLLLGVDFLLNSEFRRLSAQGLMTLHFYPTILQHGSMTGVYPSWGRSLC